MSAFIGIIGGDASRIREALRRAGDVLRRRCDGELLTSEIPGGAIAWRGRDFVDGMAASDLASDAGLVLDGSVINHRELQNEKARDLGHAATVACLLAGDADVASKFRGPFAYAHWNADTLTLARDSLGHKPLLYAVNPDSNGWWRVIFASQLLAIAGADLLPRKLSPAGVASYLWNGFVIAPATMMDGVSQLLPGERIRFDAGGKEVARDVLRSYPPQRDATADDYDDVQHALLDCIRLHLRTDQPALLISGGVDSPAVANLAQRCHGNSLSSFCLAMTDPALDESEAAAEIAAAIGCEHEKIVLTDDDFMAGLQSALDALDQPTYDALNQYCIARSLSARGFNVALGGLGGDAVFGGDATIDLLPNYARCIPSWTPAFIRKSLGHLVRMLRAVCGMQIQQRMGKLPWMAEAAPDLLAMYQIYYGLFVPPTLRSLIAEPDWLSTAPRGLPPATETWLREQMRDCTPAYAVAMLETRMFVGERLLRDADAVSSALGMEHRSPLCDMTLIEALAGVSDLDRFQPPGKKPLLRKFGLAGLSPVLFGRPKKGFVLPIERWLRERLGDQLEQEFADNAFIQQGGLTPQTVRDIWHVFRNYPGRLYWTRPWSLYCLLRWCRDHNMMA